MDRSIYTFAAELNSNNQVSDATYWKLHEHFGDEGCVELVGLIGYYHLVSLHKMYKKSSVVVHLKKG